MRRYETIFILDPDLAEDARNQRFEKAKDLITSENGVLIDFDEWGSRKLAYAINKKARGHYVRLDYCGEGKLVAELERAFRLDEKFLKFMTIILDENADPEKIKAELSSAREEEAETAEAPVAEAPVAEAPVAETTEEKTETAEPETEEDK